MTLTLVLVATLLAGGAMPLGGLLAHWERIQQAHLREDVLSATVAFGGGALLAAVALVLVPQGVEALPVVSVFLAGAVVFLLADRAIEKRGGQAGQLMGMVMDFLPESIGLGAAFAMADPRPAILLVVLIALQNLPEGFNAFRELKESGMGSRRALGFLKSLVIIGPIAGVSGFQFLGARPDVVGGVFLFAAGGILYLIFHDVAPVAYRRGHWAPTLGAVVGFAVGLVGEGILDGH